MGTDLNDHLGPVKLGEEFLAHYGIKGMRWGVRRADPSGDAARANELRGKIREGRGVHTLSNKELQEFLQRAELERRYSQATKGPNWGKRGAAGLKFARKYGPTIISVASAVAAARMARGGNFYNPTRVRSFRPGENVVEGALGTGARMLTN